jgi:hypothetical protein
VISPVAALRAPPAQADAENASAAPTKAVKTKPILLATGLIRAHLIPEIRAYTSANTTGAAQ